MDISLAQLVTAVGAVAVITSAATGFLVYLLQRKRVPFELSKVQGEITRALTEDLEKIRAELKESREREEECKKRLDDKDHEFMQVAGRLMTLEFALPSIIIAAKLRADTKSMRRVLEACRDGIVITTPSDGGRMVFVNRAFADALGMTQEDVLSKGWTELIHPDDLDHSVAAEGDMWSAGGTVVNRYKHADGHWISFRWHFTNYDEGASLSVVWFERRKSERLINEGDFGK